jgi:hypothetical protein
LDNELSWSFEFALPSDFGLDGMRKGDCKVRQGCIQRKNGRRKSRERSEKPLWYVNDKAL